MSYWSKETRRDAYKRIGNYKIGDKIMPQITGIVSDIYEGKTKAGRTPGSPFWTITLSTGNKLSTFNEEYVRPLVKGHEYLFDYTLDGQYCNLSGVPSPVIQVREELLAGDSKGVSGEQEYDTLPNVTSSEGSERTYKNRISSGQIAVQYIQGALGGTATVQDLIDIADDVEKYFNQGWYKVEQRKP